MPPTAVLTRYGPPKVLAWSSVAMPGPGPGQIRIRTHAARVSRTDLNSPGRHATAHFRLAGHPVIRSYEPGEDWYWCYVDQAAFELEGAPPAPSHR
jgi:hypothetical protein